MFSKLRCFQCFEDASPASRVGTDLVEKANDVITPPANLDHQKLEDKDHEESDQHFIFNWLDWAPEPNSVCYKALHKHFPGALPGEAVNNRIKSLLQLPEYGFTTENTLVGYSLCPDEINYEPGCLVDLMKESWGHMFPLGGISGAPFVGVTGFGAFSHHVPDDGNIIIIFGPHVAVSAEGLIGKTLREGQHHLSTACGAVIGAYNACSAAAGNDTTAGDEYNPVDMQMGWIKSQIEAHLDLVSAQPNPMAALAYQAYEMVKANMEQIVNLEFGSGKLVLIGGIQINMPHPFQEHFLPLSFEVRQKGEPSQNLLPRFDCDFSEEVVSFAKQWTPATLRPRKMSSGVLDTTVQAACNLFQEFRNVKAANFDHSLEQALDEKQGAQHAVFAWLSWSPEPGTPCFKTLHREFPGALPGPGVHCRLRKVLTEEHGFTQDNTLFGTSICPDEINNQAHGLSALMASHWGSVFPLGGLGGVPFAGKTGFKAFSHHVPVNGDIIVLYGPHVGISGTGEVGKYLRKGQDDLSTACGACIGAYNACCAAGGGDLEFDEVDIQMGFIKSQIAPHAKRISRQSCPMAALSYQAFEAVKNKVNKVVNTEFGSGRLVLIGGIQINLPEPCGDHFLPLSCEVQQAGKPTIDISEVFNTLDSGAYFEYQAMRSVRRQEKAGKPTCDIKDVFKTPDSVAYADIMGDHAILGA
mmetsp:Transcript_164271/g.315583  ORF Transcript_164271/g.315583 Transcript_164271/m.315583 type:complete len:696 (-) Transcript_164271:93-2180(-)